MPYTRPHSRNPSASSLVQDPNVRTASDQPNQKSCEAWQYPELGGGAHPYPMLTSFAAVFF